jgi:hypothetical protein
VLLDTVRPERNVLTGDNGFARALHQTRRRAGLTSPVLGEIKQACIDDPDRVAGLLVELHTAAAARLADHGEVYAPTLVLPLDQAEELFMPDAGPQADQFLTLIAEMSRRMNAAEVGLIVAATIRTDRYEAMQTAPQLADVGSVVLNELKPMPRTQFKEIITGPAARATDAGHPLRVADDLVERLLEDAGEGAAVPLLSLALSRLYSDCARTGQLTLADYWAMGGMRTVLNTEIDTILGGDPTQRQQQLDLLRSAFIPWLVTINPNNDQPARRVAHPADLAEASLPLIHALVDRRLLVRDCDTRDGRVVVEVALESLLRQWDELAGWLCEERQNLTDAEDLDRIATAWETHHRDPAWLLTGTRLDAAETLANTPGFSDRLAGTRDYVDASRQAEDEKLAAEDQRERAELQAAKERQKAAEKRAAVEEALACPRCGARLSGQS